MAKRTRRGDRPEIILEAAEGVLRRAGARGLTIDAVASEAALSKGGVLHHYASKDALIRALVARKLQQMRDGFGAHEAQVPPGAAAAASLAMITYARQTYGEEDGFPRALLLASTESPAALDDFRAFIRERLAQAGRGGGSEAGAVMVLAILGLMVGRTLGFHDLSGAEAEAVFDALDGLVRVPQAPAT